MAWPFKPGSGGVCNKYDPTEDQIIYHMMTGVKTDLPPTCYPNKYNTDGTFDDTAASSNNSTPPVGTVSSSSSRIETKVETKIENQDFDESGPGVNKNDSNEDKDDTDK